jgi:hypothetical protein
VVANVEVANKNATSAALAAQHEKPVKQATKVSASTNSPALTNQDGKQAQTPAIKSTPALTFGDLAGSLLGSNSIRIPGHARLNITYVKGNAYLRWRWHNRETDKNVVMHLGAFKPKRTGTKRISDDNRSQYEQQRTNGSKRTSKRRGKAGGRHHRA